MYRDVLYILYIRTKTYVYFIHIELAHTRSITLDWNEIIIWAWGLHHCAALIKAAKSLVPSNVRNRTWQGTVPETSAKSRAHGIYVYPRIAECISVMHGANSM